MTFKILSLDGGGSWALIQVRALQALYGPDIAGHDVLRKFDLVVANSGGSIVAAGLFLNKPLSQIANLFLAQDVRQSIFVKVGWLRLAVNWALSVTPRYSAEAKVKGLQAQLGNDALKPIRQIAVDIGKNHASRDIHLVVIGFDYDRERAMLFRSNHDSAAASPGTVSDISLLHAVHASTNAPVSFFNAPAEISLTSIAAGGTREVTRRRMWDGGISGFNNPIMAGVIDALANGFEDARVLSIGTGNVMLPKAEHIDGSWRRDPPAEIPELYIELGEPGMKADVRKLALSILSDPPDTASFIAQLVLTKQAKEALTDPRVIRLNPLIQPVRLDSNEWGLPRKVDGAALAMGGSISATAPIAVTQSDFKALIELQMDAVEEAEVALIDRFAKAWIANHVPNQPIRLAPQLRCDIGQPWFGAGLTLARNYFT